jgi:phosphoenolpyruvate synthase/pyruvate phosphate dikinase
MVVSSIPGEIMGKLLGSEAGKRVLADFNKFLDKYGWRNFMMDTYTTPSWREDTSPAWQRIQQFVNHPTFKLDEIIVKQAAERKLAEEEIVNALPVDQREWYRILMKAGQVASVWAEDHSFFFEMQAHSIGRYFWLEVGKRLVATGAIEQPDDIFMLVPQEVSILLSDPYKCKAKKKAKARRAEWDAAKSFFPEPYYGRIPQPDAMMEMMASQDVIFTKVTQEKPPEPRPELKADLIGVSGSPGIAEGIARVIMSPAQMGEVQEGEILVAPITDSTWTPVFSIIKGVVLNTGAPLCHAAIIAREYGLAAVVNTVEGTDKIKTGQRVRVDADVGAVYILDK